jgi:hypothetical protein
MSDTRAERAIVVCLDSVRFHLTVSYEISHGFDPEEEYRIGLSSIFATGIKSAEGVIIASLSPDQKRQVCIENAQMTMAEANLFLQGGHRLLQKNRKRLSTLRTIVRFVSQSERAAPPAATVAVEGGHQGGHFRLLLF